jgi:hypothetical protein
VNGSVALNGNLVVSFVNAFQAGNSDTFTVLSSTALSGVFANVASGSRLTTTDNSGSFLVTYDGTDVVLSDFLTTGHNGSSSNNQVSTGSDSSATLPNKNVTKVVPPVRTPDARIVLPRGNGRKVVTRFDNTDQIIGLLETAGTTTHNGKVILSRAHLPGTLADTGSKGSAPIQPNASSIAPRTHTSDRQLSARTASAN